MMNGIPTVKMFRTVSILALAFVLLAGTFPAAAGNGAVTETIHVSDEETFVDTLYCPDVQAEIHTSIEGVFHLTERPNGTYMVVGSARGTFEATPLGTDDVYTGRFQQSFVEIINTQTEVQQFNLNIMGVAPDGSKVNVHVVAYMIVNPNNVNFDFKVICH
jgi:hypothetical protein